MLKQEGLVPDVQLQLGDYIGNKLQYDANIRDNYSAGLLPKEIAVKQINNLTDGETREYLEKISSDDEYKRSQNLLGDNLFNEKDYYGGEE